MDFIARTGALLDRSHRITGLLLVVLVVQYFWTQGIIEEKQALQRQIMVQNKTHPVYVVPNSQAGVYKPAKNELLMSTFVDYVTQRLYTYTPENIYPQFVEIRKFLGPKLLEQTRISYKKKVAEVERNRTSSIFILNRTATELKHLKELPNKMTRYGEKVYSVILRGKQNVIVAGKVLRDKTLELTLELQETTVSKTNPFGYMVTNIRARKIKSNN